VKRRRNDGPRAVLVRDAALCTVAQTVSLRRKLTACVTLVIFGLLAGSCLPKPPAETGGGVNITLYGFSIAGVSGEGIYPAFTARETRTWRGCAFPLRSPVRNNYKSDSARREIRLQSSRSNETRRVSSNMVTLLQTGMLPKRHPQQDAFRDSVRKKRRGSGTFPIWPNPSQGDSS
jgi:hypothetical protein